MKKFATHRNFLFRKKFTFKGKNHLPEEIVRPKLTFLIENQENLFIQWEQLFEEKKEVEILAFI